MEQDYLHRVVGLYPTQAAAHTARDELLAHGLPAAQLRLIAPESAGPGADATADSDDVLKDLLRDGAIGTAVGGAAGAGATIALAAANITLFITNPVFGALYLLGVTGFAYRDAIRMHQTRQGADLVPALCQRL